MVRCKLDNQTYARKTLSKSFVRRARDQCFPTTERVIHACASTSRTPWAPHLIAAYQTSLELSLLTDYVDGGTMGDLLEFAQHGIRDFELRWWIPQAVAAVCWLHEQGFVHRDIKPANFLITTTSHLKLTDFGSAARLLPVSKDGIQRVPKEVCNQLCGTVDYISPDMLEYDEQKNEADEVQEDLVCEGYGRETDWWSLGVMVYEMAYGVLPFFAERMEDTLKRIVNHQRTFQFPSDLPISSLLKSLIQRLLTDAGSRLGRKSLYEVQKDEYFRGMPWSNLHKLSRPDGLLVPQFTDSTDVNNPSPEQEQGSEPASSFPSGSFTTIQAESTLRSKAEQIDTKIVSPTDGFTWGPLVDAFDQALGPSAVSFIHPTPRVLRRPTVPPSASRLRRDVSYSTPLRSGRQILGTSTVRRTRAMSERQALQQLMSAVRESAHKKVLQSGKKTHIRFTRRERAIVPMGKSAGVDLEDDADLTFRTADGPPSPSPRPGSSMARTRPPSRATPTEEWPSLVHEKEMPNKWEDMHRRMRTLAKGVEDAEKRLNELKVLV
ncbi:kinase-like protein [Dacryopinax primogenitus]|uniref:non-specific serine/threonine protein kinase n=1 Tax=Dacryopinax primogenitus (strain DJM 731) TaxID=1858805 RepID=M5FND0_DACPD|nr:kinase-like protein [Dacryopinax primogenitus]EJT97230.1 kinase-like protein [Dacryopinax primogenitus]